ncbi:hypothetical protein QAD02_017063 [Eretmocerus hayati]|uniref:Uncharacterized protein n=1 Tax=Eretmocerus hayati TaxID=131215 RepID=A0ACC2PCT3_9HYME|nr:hypothetical protein QAD02_017063 [Eretmocerus hayati]
MSFIHKKCRNSLYPSTDIQRFKVPDDKVAWSENFPEYTPIEYSSKFLTGKPWADPDSGDPNFKPLWNALDNNGKINRKSFLGIYDINENNQPLNPFGRTGISGRGLLGRWGPNHAADPIVTRWKRNSDQSVVLDEITRKPILQFVCIQRRDSGEWAIPGGMVDPGEKVSTTLKREFMEEAMNSLENKHQNMEAIENHINNFFQCGQEVYNGYVDDPRNTDNAWMETTAFNFHDETGDYVGNMNLEAGDDAKHVEWRDMSNALLLYASHKDFLTVVAEKHKAHW